MTRHISTSRLQRFRVRALPAGELTSIVEHLDVCNACTQQFTEMLKSARGGEPLKFTLAPEFQTRHEHVDYEQLVRLADKTMDASQREMTDVHLKICAPCQEDVRSFLAFREKIEREMNVSYVTIGQQPAADVLSASVIGSWRGLVWKPIYAAAVVLIGIAIIIGAAMLLNRRASNQQVQHQSIPSISPDSHPDNRAAHSSPSLSGPNESRTVDPNTAEATIVISDRTGTITVDKSGNVTGLDDVPASTRDEIVKVLSSEQLERPAILKELGGQETGLRGNSDRSPFKLVSPSRTVIITDSPILKWEKAAGATSYRVYINDLAGHVVKKAMSCRLKLQIGK